MKKLKRSNVHIIGATEKKKKFPELKNLRFQVDGFHQGPTMKIVSNHYTYV